METFLELHERLSKDNILHPEYNHDWSARYHKLKLGLCGMRFNDDFFSSDKIVAQYFDLANKKVFGKPGIYTPLRQNIVLLCAAINNEL
jgi:hypothetical protein